MPRGPARRCHALKRFSAVFLFVLLAFLTRAWAEADHCAICGAAINDTLYTVIDKVTHTRVFLCRACASCPDECYICGLPVRANYLRLGDGRFLCARDAKTAVLDERQARDMCADVVENLNKMFSRFLTLPSTNVRVGLVDQVNLFDEFIVAGNNFECPDVLGYIQTRTNLGGFRHSISLMSALPRA